MLALRLGAPMVGSMNAVSAIPVFEPKEQVLPVVLSCPHAGTVIPEDLRAVSALDDDILLGATDFGVEALVRPAAEALGVPMVSRGHLST